MPFLPTPSTTLSTLSHTTMVTQQGLTFKWYILRSVSGKENQAKHHIEIELKTQKLDKYVGDIVIPKEKVIQMRRGKKVQVEKMFFPGYLLVEAHLTPEVVLAVKSIQNVGGFLSTTRGGDPVPMRDDEVKRILGRVKELEVEEQDVDVPFKEGESVKIVEGPFVGLTGTIDKINKEKRKLQLSVVIFGRKTPLELSFIQVNPIA